MQILAWLAPSVDDVRATALGIQPKDDERCVKDDNRTRLYNSLFFRIVPSPSQENLVYLIIPLYLFNSHQETTSEYPPK